MPPGIFPLGQGVSRAAYQTSAKVRKQLDGMGGDPAVGDCGKSLS